MLVLLLFLNENLVRIEIKNGCLMASLIKMQCYIYIHNQG